MTEIWLEVRMKDGKKQGCEIDMGNTRQETVCSDVER